MVRKIRKAAVIGSGVMGGGIAALLASAGIKTLMLDIVPFDLTEEEKKDPKARNRMVKAGYDNLLTIQPALLMQKKDIGLISIGNLEDDFDQLADCDWIVEVVVENLKVKQDLFARIDKVRKGRHGRFFQHLGHPAQGHVGRPERRFPQAFPGDPFFQPGALHAPAGNHSRRGNRPDLSASWRISVNASRQGHRLGQGHPQLRGQPHRGPGHGQIHAADGGRGLTMTGGRRPVRPGHGAAQDGHVQNVRSGRAGHHGARGPQQLRAGHGRGRKERFRHPGFLSTR
jgi:hypothetical protein